MLEIVDPHLHFFDLDKGDYFWLKHTPPNWPNLNEIRDNHGLEDLQQSSQFRLTSLVHVEAGFDNQNPEREIHWLNETLAQFPFKAVSYCTIDAAPEVFQTALEKLRHPRLIAVRDITEGHDARRLLNAKVLENLLYLSSLGLHFEAQLEFVHVDIITQLATWLAQHPTLNIVFNHAGFISELERSKWQYSLQQLKDLDNAFIKLSGLEMLSARLSTSETVDTLLSHFGENRVMLASNYPVCLMQQSHEQCWQDYLCVIGNNPTWSNLSCENAKRIYQF
ncbi:amidohydrolase family protein [Pseudoalteromonas sp. T1lg65]|uniref:amidohydrolase family protein n=1 Tax=Pseudoalteromonas sp. T1lg65 TaxID=2077101 RepID=UPI003F7A4039